MVNFSKTCEQQFLNFSKTCEQEFQNIILPDSVVNVLWVFFCIMLLTCIHVPGYRYMLWYELQSQDGICIGTVFTRKIATQER